MSFKALNVHVGKEQVSYTFLSVIYSDKSVRSKQERKWLYFYFSEQALLEFQIDDASSHKLTERQTQRGDKAGSLESGGNLQFSTVLEPHALAEDRHDNDLQYFDFSVKTLQFSHG